MKKIKSLESKLYEVQKYQKKDADSYSSDDMSFDTKIPAVKIVQQKHEQRQLPSFNLSKTDQLQHQRMHAQQQSIDNAIEGRRQRKNPKQMEIL